MQTRILISNGIRQMRLGFVVLAFAAQGAVAFPITYTFTATATGTAGVQTFTDAAITFVLVGDTLGVTVNQLAIARNPVVGTVTIGGIGTATITEPIWASSSCGAGNPFVGMDHEPITIIGTHLFLAGIGPFSLCNLNVSPLASLTTLGSMGFSNVGSTLGPLSLVLSTPITYQAEAPPLTIRSALSRKTHGAAGTYDIVLSLDPANPTTEPRQGPTATLVMTWGAPIVSATAAVTEGIGIAGVPTFSGNDVIVDLTGVADQQYVTVTLTNVASSTGDSGGIGSIRIGLLAGDINRNRVVTLGDLGSVNAKLTQPVTSNNFFFDVNVSGTLTVGDVAAVNANLTKALPAP